MIRVLTPSAQRRRRNDVGGGVETLTAASGLIQYPVIAIKPKRRPGKITEPRVQQLPRRDAIEELEQQNPKQDLVRILTAAVDHVVDQILAYSIGCAIAVSEAV